MMFTREKNFDLPAEKKFVDKNFKMSKEVEKEEESDSDYITEEEYDGEDSDSEDSDSEDSSSFIDAKVLKEKMNRMKNQFGSKKKNPPIIMKSSSYGFLFNKQSSFVLDSPNQKNNKEIKNEKMIRNMDELSRVSKNKEIDKENETKPKDNDKKKEEMTHEEMRMHLISLGISPEYEPAFKRQPRKKPKELQVDDVRTFLSSPIPKEMGLVHFFIVRRRKFGRLNKYPKYFLYYEKNGKFLLGSRRRKKSKSANYLLSLDESDLSRSSGNYFGKLRGNFLGTEFLLFDKGESPLFIKKDSNQYLRNMLAGIKYEKNMFGSQGPRKLTVILPKIDNNGKFITFPQEMEKPTLVDLYNQDKWDDIIILKNNSPSWSEDLGSFVLDFNGRVTVASIKNFQIVDPRKKKSKILMQFGRISKNKFAMDIRYPFSPIQAFCVCLSACDSKLLAE